MVTTIYKNNKKNIVFAYFLCIIIGIITVIYNAMNIDSSSSIYYSIIVGISFVIQVCIIVFASGLKLSLKVSKNTELLKFLFLISPFFTLFKQALVEDINTLDIINSFSRFILVYVYWTIAENNVISKENFNFFMKYIVYLGLLASFYNIIVNYNKFSLLFNYINPYELAFKSFFTNRNAFAQFLLFCMMSNLYLLKIYKMKRFRFSLIILALNLLFTLSRTAIGCSLLFMILMEYSNLKKIKVKNIIINFLVIILVIFFLLNPVFKNFISHMIIRAEYGSGRLDVWNLAINTLKNNGLLLGMGYENSIRVFQAEGYSLKEFHSFYLETLVGGGLFDLTIYSLILKYILDRVSLIKTFDKEIGSFYRASIFTFMIYAIFESISLFRIGYVGTIFTIYLFTIPLLYSNSCHYKLVEKRF